MVGILRRCGFLFEAISDTCAMCRDIVESILVASLRIVKWILVRNEVSDFYVQLGGLHGV